MTQAPSLSRIASALLCGVLVALSTISTVGAELPSQGISLQGTEKTAEGFCRFFFDVKLGQSYPLAVSDDLVHWTLLKTVDQGRGNLFVSDPEPATLPRRFYRIGVEPARMVYIPPGTFTMGSPTNEPARNASEGPQTIVTLTRGFWMAKYEVSQADFLSVMGSNPSSFPYDPRLPVETINWTTATEYCQNLTKRELAAQRIPAGYSYRLPTEAEWEYACRAGTTTPFGIGDGKNLSSAEANFDGGFPYGSAPRGRYVESTTLPGTYSPNAWGLYDMHGNVWEFCSDWYGPFPGGSVIDPKGPATGTDHVLRGGGYSSPGQGCRSAKRDHRSPAFRNFIQGFRIVLAPDS
jgi:formylglycine-generating enzyme required for sulfatase activity